MAGQSDHPFNPNGAVPHQLSRHDIANQSRVVFSLFVRDRVADGRLSGNVSVDDLIAPGTPTGPPIEQIRQMSEAMRYVSYDVEQEARYRRLIDEIPPDATERTFFEVAREIFSDGMYNWGRIMTLFDFAFEMVRKRDWFNAIHFLQAEDQLTLIRSIIDWVVNFIVDYVANWILEQGGWEAIQFYVGSTSRQMWGVVAAGVLVGGLVVLWRSWR